MSKPLSIKDMFLGTVQLGWGGIIHPFVLFLLIIIQEKSTIVVLKNYELTWRMLIKILIKPIRFTQIYGAFKNQ